MRVFSTLMLVIVLFAGSLFSSAAFAHGIWFAERATQLALIYGVGADDLDSVKRLHKVETINAYDDGWDEIEAALRVAGPILVVDANEKPFAVSAIMQNGLWSHVNGDWKKGGRDENPDAQLAEKTVKYAVHIPGELSREIPLLPDQILQIIPVGDVMPTMMGEEITVRVHYKGNPVAGAKVKVDWVTDPDGKPIVTGKDGLASFKVRNQGLNVIAATYDGPSDMPKIIDKVEHFATLSFVLAHEPE